MELPAQKSGDSLDYRSVCHRDGTVFSAVTLDDLEAAEQLYRKLGAKLVGSCRRLGGSWDVAALVDERGLCSNAGLLLLPWCALPGSSPACTHTAPLPLQLALKQKRCQPCLLQVVGMPFKDIATSDSIFMRSLPVSGDADGRRALKRLQEVRAGAGAQGWCQEEVRGRRVHSQTPV